MNLSECELNNPSTLPTLASVFFSTRFRMDSKKWLWNDCVFRLFHWNRPACQIVYERWLLLDSPTLLIITIRWIHSNTMTEPIEMQITHKWPRSRTSQAIRTNHVQCAERATALFSTFDALNSVCIQHRCRRNVYCLHSNRNVIIVVVVVVLEGGCGEVLFLYSTMKPIFREHQPNAGKENRIHSFSSVRCGSVRSSRFSC